MLLDTANMYERVFNIYTCKGNNCNEDDFRIFQIKKSTFLKNIKINSSEQIKLLKNLNAI